MTRTTAKTSSAAARPSAAASSHHVASKPSTASAGPVWLATPARPAGVGALIQCKVTVGAAGDAHEREADRVADSVAGGQAVSPSSISRLAAGAPASLAQRAPMDGASTDAAEPEPKLDKNSPLQLKRIQLKSSAHDEPTATPDADVQRKSGGAGAVPASGIAGAERALASGSAGASLPGPVRGTLESRMHVDLSEVRVHSGPDAAEAASGLQARAFTHGRDIWLGRGESPSDTRLMAHEATHVLQQDGVVRRKPADDVALSDDEADKRKPPPGTAETAVPSPPIAPRAAPGAAAPAPPAAAPAPVAAPAAAPAPPTPAPGAAASTSAAAPAAPTAADYAQPVAAPPVPVLPPEEAATPEPATEPGVAAAAPAAAETAMTTPATTPAPAPPAAAPLPAETPAKPPAAPAALAAPMPAAGPAGPMPAAAPAGPMAAAAAPAAAVPAPAAGAPAAMPAAGAGSVAGAGAGGAAPAEAETAAAAAPSPETDPGFMEVSKGIAKLAKSEAAHAPAAAKVTGAEKAAVQPASEPLAKGMVAQTADMAAKSADVVKPEEKSFEQLLEEALERLTPKTPEDVENIGEKGAGGAAVAAEVKGGVAKMEAGSKAAVDGATKKEPAPTGLETATPLAPEKAEAAPPKIGAEQVLPTPKPDAEVSMEADKASATSELGKTGLTEEQLAKANEPSFNAALKAKSEVDQNSDAAPERYGVAEAGYLDTAKKQVADDENKARADMRTTRDGKKKGTLTKQEQLKLKREEERAVVAKHIQESFSGTKASVEGKLKSLDETIDKMFDEGQAAAFETMKGNIGRRLTAFKIERYGSRALIPLIGGLIAAGTWVYDQVRGIDQLPEVGRIYTEERETYVRSMKALFRRMGAEIEKTLRECKDEIAAGKKKIADYVDGLGAELKAFGKESLDKIGGEFDALEKGVDGKKGDLAEKMAGRYKESREAVDKFITEERAKNRGLLQRLVEAVGEVIATIRKLRDRLGAILAKAKGSLNLIIADPIQFLKNIIDAVKLGFFQFKDNIVEHLKTGLFGWLFGALASAGINLPKDFSISSIFGLVMDILGITKAKMRAKAVKLIGERNVAILEKVWEFVSVLISEGPAGLWEKVKEYLSDLKDTVIEGIKEWVISNVVKAAITKLVSLFNPIGAFIQAALGIYNTVMFFVERIDQILTLVETIVSSVYDIALGKITAAANWVEKALGNTVPVIISFLARLLGLGGVSEKIKNVVEKVQTKVDGAIDQMIAKIVGAIGKLFGKGKAEKNATGDPAHDAKWSAGTAAVQKDVAAMEKGGVTQADLDAAIPNWKKTYGFTSMEVKPEGEGFEVDGAMSESKKIISAGGAGTEKDPFLIEWPKPPAAGYRTLYFGGKTKKTITQDQFKELRDKKEKVGGEDIEAYSPLKQNDLPKGETIGLEEESRLKKDHVVGPARSMKNPGGKKINKALEPFGYDASKEGMDGDHLREIQVSGEDKISNLWPLKKGLNRSGGSLLSQLEVTVKGKKKPMPKLKGAEKYYFKITGFSVSKDPG